ncbi:hypothetical protein [uncultured Paracoccus sp.]|uniref:hypothetical protein n=1 Tax=uncultured Paracoccus sp. TaxID=189685 RepID=UPI0026341C00|nr:hypothetical protein [uncultured Paracoccus sp.]
MDDILGSMHRRINALGLDLSGLTVITEAATGFYSCTASIAAMAGAAHVHAVARDTRRYGTFEDAASATLSLAKAAGVADRVTVSRAVEPRMLTECDILTNSGHLRPISAEMIAHLPDHAVIALMFEAWEFRDADLDLLACRKRGIRVAGVNERHPQVGVFPFLGPLCVRLLSDAGLALRGARISLLCDNPFAPFIEQGLTRAGASVAINPSERDRVDQEPDAVVVALDPSRNSPLAEKELSALAGSGREVLLAQFWGDVDREAARHVWPGPVWPPSAPPQGHMAVLLSELGHEPVVRLQAGGLRAAEIVARGGVLADGGVAELI